MTTIGHVIGWLAVSGLLWIAAIALVAAILHADAVYAAFAVLFGSLALALAVSIGRESGWSI